MSDEQSKEEAERRAGAITHAIVAYGGSLAGFLINLGQRLFTFGTGGHSGHARAGWPAAPPRSPAPATGPP